MDKKYSRETLCVQAGWTPKKGEPRVLPIYQSTTFKYDTSEQMARLFDLEDSGYFYTRLQNPTNDAVAAKIAALEGGVGAMLTSSGQAANFYAIFNICQAGDHFVCSSTIYGGTFNLFGVTLKKLGIECTFIDANASEEEIDKAFRPNTNAAALIVKNAYKYYEEGDDSVLPRSIATRDAFLNAMTLDIAMGGSTNTVLHLLAIAHEAEVDFKMDDIDMLSRHVPISLILRSEESD